MKIILNNKEEIIDKEKLNIKSLLDIKNYTFKLLVIKINGQLIKKDQYANTEIKEGDHVSVIHLISGG